MTFILIPNDRRYQPAAGYDGDVGVEHEDPVWGGTPSKTLQGMQIAARTLRPLIVTEANEQPPAPEVQRR
jgi:hypothetical protein